VGLEHFLLTRQQRFAGGLLREERWEQGSVGFRMKARLTHRTTALIIAPQEGGSDSPEALVELVETRRNELFDLLFTHGAILFRGFTVASSSVFGEVVTLLSRGCLHEYAGGASPRQLIGQGHGPIYNSTDYPAELELPLHNELSYSNHYPNHIYFCCLVEPGHGGATTLGDSRRILEAMPGHVRSPFEAKGLKYIRLLGPEKGSGYSWQDAFRCDQPRVVEAQCTETGAEWEWLADGHLKVVQQRPALARHPRTGEEVWFNQALGFHPSGLDPVSYAELIRIHGDESRFRLNVQYGDGSPIDHQTIRHVAAVLQREAVPHIWKAGDVLILDNLLMAHGRAPFRGPRSIAVAMS
jgi:alpha-ketoglutarate-dependent taurine dioxygenase